jgi:heme oxygenase
MHHGRASKSSECFREEESSQEACMENLQYQMRRIHKEVEKRVPTPSGCIKANAYVSSSAPHFNKNCVTDKLFSAFINCGYKIA